MDLLYPSPPFPHRLPSRPRPLPPLPSVNSHYISFHLLHTQGNADKIFGALYSIAKRACLFSIDCLGRKAKELRSKALGDGNIRNHHCVINDPSSMGDFTAFLGDLYRPLKADGFKLAKFNPHFICAGTTKNMKDNKLKTFYEQFAPSRPGFIAMRTKKDSKKVEVRVRKTLEERKGKAWPFLESRLGAMMRRDTIEPVGDCGSGGGMATGEVPGNGMGAGMGVAAVGVLMGEVPGSGMCAGMGEAEAGMATGEAMGEATGEMAGNTTGAGVGMAMAGVAMAVATGKAAGEVAGEVARRGGRGRRGRGGRGRGGRGRGGRGGCVPAVEAAGVAAGMVTAVAADTPVLALAPATNKRKKNGKAKESCKKQKKEVKAPFVPINVGRANYFGHNCFAQRSKLPWIGAGSKSNKNRAASNSVSKMLYPPGYTEEVAVEGGQCAPRNILWRMPQELGRWPHELMANQLGGRPPLDASAVAVSTDKDPRACPPLRDMAGNIIQSSARNALNEFEAEHRDIQSRLYLCDFMEFYATKRGLTYNQVPCATPEDVACSEGWKAEFKKTQSTVSEWNKPRLQQECNLRGIPREDWEHLKKVPLYTLVRKHMAENDDEEEEDDSE